MELLGLDHTVMTVTDVDETCTFYRSVGGAIVEYGEGRIAIHLGDQKLNVHPTENDITPVAANPTPGSHDICILTDATIEAIVSTLERADISIEIGPVTREGARGQLESVYVRDPDGNLVEIATYVDGR